ncbi:hypothetical protein LNQ81_15285 [Myroides sp. M-43]|uniref:hypothetical protein n=1 Tax=Myroides oncorhynchi TaxID=2893756 RepID=UPI001E4D9389|nr:hypothetical protein [Myroides oncorhynchi]MCC9044039.1 hypothetical protein [Myroides oncorhynchi]
MNYTYFLYGLVVWITLSIVIRRIARSSKTPKLSHSQPSPLGVELIEVGFLQYANPELIDSLELDIIESFYIHDDETYKFAHIDAEAMAEFNFNFFLPRLNKMLGKRALELEVKVADDYEQTYDIIINENKINLYTQYDLDNDLVWDTSVRNFFKEVNAILQYNFIKERFYLVSGGNDLATLLLTDKEFLIIMEYFKDNPNEIPYKP